MDLYPVKIPLITPFITSLHSVDVKNCIIVRLTTDEGIVGWGEAAPEIEITGDDHKIAYETLDRSIRDIIVDKTIDNIGDFHDILNSLSKLISTSSTSVAAVDIALHDLWAKINKIPLYQFFNGSHGPLATSISIGIMEIDRLINTIGKLIESEVSIIKLKIGSGIEKDYTTIKKVRETFGYDFILRLDANQGYTYKDALILFNQLEEFKIEFIEQPVKYDNLTDLKLLHEECPIPIMADESISSFDDLMNVAKNNICNRVNIKLMKSGGLHPADRLIQFCNDQNIDCMIGCMIETPIGIAAGVHLGLQNKSVKWTDLDGHLFFGNIDHIFSGLRTEKGFNTVSKNYGLGLNVDETALINHINYVD
jgi:o-succinylbenzoate synthase